MPAHDFTTFSFLFLIWIRERVTYLCSTDCFVYADGRKQSLNTLCNELLCTHLIGHHLKCLNNSAEVSNKAVRKLILKCYMLDMQYFNTDSALE